MFYQRALLTEWDRIQSIFDILFYVGFVAPLGACTCIDTESVFLLLVDEIFAEMFGQCAIYNRL